MLTALLVIPILGIFGILLVEENTETQKKLALTVSLINFVLSLALWIGFDNSYNGFQYVTEFAEIGFCHFHIGVDGISIFFVLLTTFIIPLCILSSWDSIKIGIKYFMIAFLILEKLYLLRYLLY